MCRFLLHPLFALALCASTAAAQVSPAATPKPGILTRTWSATKKLNPFHPKTEAQKAMRDVSAMFKGLELKVLVEPAVPQLGENRQLTVTLRLHNKGAKLVHLEFPTTQRFEVLVKNSIGKVVAQWSEDHAFTGDPGLVTINPGERLEYQASVATREMAAGEEYTVEGFFPNYEPLRSSVKVVPVR